MQTKETGLVKPIFLLKWYEALSLNLTDTHRVDSFTGCLEKSSFQIISLTNVCWRKKATAQLGGGINRLWVNVQVRLQRSIQCHWHFYLFPPHHYFCNFNPHQYHEYHHHHHHNYHQHHIHHHKHHNHDHRQPGIGMYLATSGGLEGCPGVTF